VSSAWILEHIQFFNYLMLKSGIGYGIFSIVSDVVHKNIV
jgi:hypothetical protein